MYFTRVLQKTGNRSLISFIYYLRQSMALHSILKIIWPHTSGQTHKMDIQIHNDLNSILQIYQNIKTLMLKNTACRA